jgi:hypothetical protein
LPRFVHAKLRLKRALTPSPSSGHFVPFSPLTPALSPLRPLRGEGVRDGRFMKNKLISRSFINSVSALAR